MPCIVPCADMGQCSVHTPTPERVGVGLRAVEYLFGADVACPYIGIGEEETLLGCETVFLSHRGVTILLRGILEGVEGDLQASVVGDVLAEREGAVGEHTRGDFDMVEILLHDLGACLEVGFVFRCPPVDEVTVFVELTASKPWVISCPMTTPIAP